MGCDRAVDQESFVLHGQLGIEGEIMFGMNALAGIRYCQGDVAAAIQTIEAALEIAQRLGFHHDRGLQRTLLGQDVLKPDLPVQVGLFASGQIERVFYPGAYVEGTAIGFTG